MTTESQFQQAAPLFTGGDLTRSLNYVPTIKLNRILDGKCMYFLSRKNGLAYKDSNRYIFLNFSFLCHLPHVNYLCAHSSLLDATIRFTAETAIQTADVPGSRPETCGS